MKKKYDDAADGEIEVVPPVDEEAKTHEKAPAESIVKLTQALEQKSKELAEANDKYLRTYADFENYRKRMQRDLADFRKYANEQLALELLSVVDHLGLALKHASESSEAGENNSGLRQGVELVYKQFRDTLEKFGVKPFNAEGELFDPAKHDAMTQVSTAEAPENTVVEVFQEGYRYYDKILRHAKVGVAKSPPQAEECPSCD
jgi:molecular chaperone GrpE